MDEKISLKRWQARLSLLEFAPAYVLKTYLFFVTLLVFLLTQVNVIGGDSPPTVFLPVTLLRWGTFRLDRLIGEVPVLFDLSRRPHYLVFHQGHYYSKFSPLTSILVLPLYGLYLLLGGKPDDYFSYLILSRVAAALMSSVNVVMMFGLLRRMLSQRQALFLALVYAFGTFTWAFATNTLATQATGELFLLGALGKLFEIADAVDAGKPLGRSPALWGGLCLALALVARVQLLPVAGLLGLGIISVGKWRSGFWAALGGLPVIILWGLYNTLAFGAPWSTGYGLESQTGWTTPLWEGLTGILFSPAHGLLMYSPVLLLAFPGAWALWRNNKALLQGRSAQRLLRLSALACLVFLLMMSCWWAWHGGNAYNQRMLQEIHPLIMLLVGCAWQAFGRWRIFRLSLGLASLWPMLMNLARVTFYDRHIDFVERFNRALVWAWREGELAMYIRWHGAGAFVRELLTTTARVGGIVLVLTALLGIYVWLRHALTKPR